MVMSAAIKGTVQLHFFAACFCSPAQSRSKVQTTVIFNVYKQILFKGFLTNMLGISLPVRFSHISIKQNSFTWTFLNPLALVADVNNCPSTQICHWLLLYWQWGLWRWLYPLQRDRLVNTVLLLGAQQSHQLSLFFPTGFTKPAAWHFVIATEIGRGCFEHVVLQNHGCN